MGFFAPSTVIDTFRAMLPVSNIVSGALIMGITGIAVASSIVSY